MTMRKKLLITIACLSVILCTMVTGTIAWLIDDTPTIINTFTPSNITVELKENGTDTDNKQQFQMIPGKTYTKDPKVTVTNDIDCYVFVKIEKANDFDDFMAYAIAGGWTQLEDADGNTVDGVYSRVVPADATQKAFSVLGAGSVDVGGKTYSWEADRVLIRPDVTKAMMEALFNAGADNYPTLTFTAYAIQQEGFATAALAWAEITKQ